MQTYLTLKSIVMALALIGAFGYFFFVPVICIV